MLQLENLTNLQHRHEAHELEQVYLDKITKLQSSLHESKEHCGKLRQQYERYDSCLCTQMGQLVVTILKEVAQLLMPRKILCSKL